jgi:L-lactate dehydrogenase complex protein LldG
MKVSASKANILKKIREALATPVPIPFPQSEGNSSVYQPSVKEMEVEFAENFTHLLGKFVFCLNEAECVAQLVNLFNQMQWQHVYCVEESLRAMIGKNGFSDFTNVDLSACDVSLTTAESLIARTGSMFLSSATESGRTVSVYAPVHICIAYTDQLVYDIKDGLQLLKEKYGNNIPSQVSLATGPSRTADIEKTLVVGVHGPKEVYVFLIDRAK